MDAVDTGFLLRNTTHGEGLTQAAVSRFGTRDRDLLVHLAESESGKLLEKVDRLGAAEAWGFHALQGNAAGINPAVLVGMRSPFAPTKRHHLRALFGL